MCIDKINNSHGQALIDFLIEGKLAIVNGRVYQLSDSITCLLVKGRSVVDYFILGHDNINNVLSFAVNPISDTVENLGIVDMCDGRVSNHAILSGCI